MLQRLVTLSALAFAAFGVLPAQAQIILGGEPVATPGVAAAAALQFPQDPAAADFKPVAVAVPTFSGASETEAALARKVSETVANDLLQSGLFAVTDPSAYATLQADIGALPAWAGWSATGAQALVFGKVMLDGDARLTVQYRLYDVGASKQMVGQQYVLPAGSETQAAHKVADDIYAALAGGKGYFDSRIAFISEIDGRPQLGVVGQDGAGAEHLLTNVPTIEAPRFSPDGDRIVYSADAPVPGKPSQAQRTTILYNLTTGERQPLPGAAQPNPDARFAPSGAALVFSRTVAGNSDIYLFDLAAGTEIRLINDRAKDAAPALSPDGQRVAFVSDRGGGTQLYVANVDGSPSTCADGRQAAACRLSGGAGAYASPEWSPAGDLIVFSRRTGAISAIGIIAPDGTGERDLTSGALDSSPSWSPDGRAVVFAREAGGQSHLEIVTLYGGKSRRVATPGQAFAPDWGPNLP